MRVRDEKPTIEWLRLTPPQTRVLLLAWSKDSIVCAGRDLNVAHRLARRGLLNFLRPIEGGMKGEFSLTDIARDYPPTGLKTLVIQPCDRAALRAMKEAGE